MWSSSIKVSKQDICWIYWDRDINMEHGVKAADLAMGLIRLTDGVKC